jgi:uncharacterized membrane protein
MSDIPSAPPPRRRVSWLLIVSLCLNIALVPVIAAVVMRALHRETQIGAGGILAPRSLMAALPDERRKIQKIIDAHTPAIQKLRAASVRTRVEAFEVLASPTYTPEKLTAALQGVTAADGALETESVAMLGESLAALTPAERAAIVEKVRKRNRSWLYRMFKPKLAP